MIFQNQTAELPHPADSLGAALTRATGVLSALTSCHDAQNGGFAVSDQFVLQAVAAVEGFVADARNAYMDLCNKCDLRLVEDQPPVSNMVDQSNSDEPAILPPLPIETTTESKPLIEEFAPSYDDLLRKLTAAEVFAAERDGNSRPDSASTLLPLLKSLRQDLEKIRAA